MKVDRRSFLGLGIGAVAGIAVSPVGAKLTDDFSIWTQNWPWTPVPPDGEISFDRSICHLCPGACGISVRKIDNRPVKIEGLEQYPVNEGGVCMHGIAGLQYLYDPSRVKTPLKKSMAGLYRFPGMMPWQRWPEIWEHFERMKKQTLWPVSLIPIRDRWPACSSISWRHSGLLIF